MSEFKELSGAAELAEEYTNIGDSLVDENLKEASVAEKGGHLGQVWVSAAKLWQPSGIHVEQGQMFDIVFRSYCVAPRCPGGPAIHEVYWRVNDSHKYYGPNGINISASNGYVLPGAREGSLIYKIGPNGTPKKYGNNQVAYASGELYFIANDDIARAHGSGFSDNSGRVHIYVNGK